MRAANIHGNAASISFNYVVTKKSVCNNSKPVLGPRDTFCSYQRRSPHYTPLVDELVLFFVGVIRFACDLNTRKPRVNQEEVIGWHRRAHLLSWLAVLLSPPPDFCKLSNQNRMDLG